MPPAFLRASYAPIYTRLCGPVARNVTNWEFVRLENTSGGTVTVRYFEKDVEQAKAAAALGGAAKLELEETKTDNKMVTHVYQDREAALHHLSHKFFLQPLITMCRDEFQKLLTAVDHVDFYARNKRKAALMGNARFIGHLFSAGFLNIKIINRVLQQLCNLAGLTDDNQIIPAPGQPGHRQVAARAAEREAARKAAKQFDSENPSADAAERDAFVAEAATAAREAVLNEVLTPEQVAADVEMRELAIEELCELLKVSYDKLVSLEAAEAAAAASKRKGKKSKKAKKGGNSHTVSARMVESLRLISMDKSNSNRTRFMCLDVLERDFNQIVANASEIVDTQAPAAHAASKAAKAKAAADAGAGASPGTESAAAAARKSRRRANRQRGPKSFRPSTSMFGAASASAAPAAAAGGAGASAGAGAEAGSGAAEGPVVLDDIKVTSEMKSAAQALLMSYEGDAAVADLAKFVATHGAAAATRALLSQALSVAAEKKAAYRPLAAKCLADGLASGLSAAVFVAVLDDELQWFSDVLIDVPLYGVCTGAVLGPALARKLVPFTKVKELVDTRIVSNASTKRQAASIVASALVSAVDVCGRATVDSFVADNGAALRELLATGSPSSSIAKQFDALALSL